MKKQWRNNVKVKRKKDEIIVGKIALGGGFTVTIPDANLDKHYTLSAHSMFLEEITFTGISGKLLQEGFHFKIDEEKGNE